MAGATREEAKTIATVTREWKAEMGEVRVRLTLSNWMDEQDARRDQTPADRIRRVEVDALVDAGSTFLVVPAYVSGQLGLRVLGRSYVRGTDGAKVLRDRVGIVTIDLMGRRAEVEAIVEPERSCALLGQIPLYLLDLWVDARTLRLVPNPDSPDGPLSDMQ